MPVGLELCVDSLADAIVAAQAGAVRIELNTALELGGLTPPIGLVEMAIQALRPFDCPVIAMVRPRPGGFAYSDDALCVMSREIARLLEAGVAGVALGVLNADGTIDADRCAELIESVLSSGCEIVFHRAFDLTPDPHAALDTLIELGFHRVLTSGGQATAIDGSDMIRALIDHAQGKIELLPGGGIRPHNVADLVQITGCTQVHASLRDEQADPSGSANTTLDFNSPPAPAGGYHQADASLVNTMIEAIRQL